MAILEQEISITHTEAGTIRVYAQYDDAARPMKFTGLRVDSRAGSKSKVEVYDNTVCRQTDTVESGRNDTRDISALDLTATESTNRQGEDIISPDDGISFMVVTA